MLNGTKAGERPAEMKALINQVDTGGQSALLETLLEDPDVRRGFLTQQRSTDHLEIVRTPVAHTQRETQEAQSALPMFVDPELPFEIAQHRRSAGNEMIRLSAERNARRAAAARRAMR